MPSAIFIFYTKKTGDEKALVLCHINPAVIISKTNLSISCFWKHGYLYGLTLKGHILEPKWIIWLVARFEDKVCVSRKRESNFFTRVVNTMSTSKLIEATLLWLTLLLKRKCVEKLWSHHKLADFYDETYYWGYFVLFEINLRKNRLGQLKQRFSWFEGLVMRPEMKQLNIYEEIIWLLIWW